MNEGHFVKNIPCPKCRENGNDRSGDNLAVYSNGNSWCWSCHYFESSNLASSKLHHKGGKRRSNITRHVNLPEDASPNYPQEVLDWVGKYELGESNLIQLGALYSEQGVYIRETHLNKLLIFPFWHKTENDLVLEGWQARIFGNYTKARKYYSLGNLQDICYRLKSGVVDGSKGNTLVLCEDIISAIKISLTGYQAIPLFGINAKGRRHQFIGIDNLIIFLDPDMHKHSLEEASILRLYGYNVHVILSVKDPKEYSFFELKEVLNDKINN